MVVCKFISRSKSLLSSQNRELGEGRKKGPACVPALSVTHAPEAHEAIGSRRAPDLMAGNEVARLGIFARRKVGDASHSERPLIEAGNAGHEFLVPVGRCGRSIRAPVRSAHRACCEG